MALISSMLDNVIEVAKGKNMGSMEIYRLIERAAAVTSREADIALDQVGAILESPEYTASCAYQIVCATPRNGGFDYNGLKKPTFKFEYAEDIDGVVERLLNAGIESLYDKAETAKSITVIV
jgi:hypothetical protein